MRRVCEVLAMAGVLVGATACADTPAKVASTPTPAPTKTEHSPSAPATPPPPPAPPAGNQLPRGGRVIFPKYQLVGYVGLPGSPALGPLDKDLETKTATLEKLSKSYADGRTPQPVMELIAVVAKGSPGKDGLYRGRLADAAIDEYLTVARKHKMLLLLDIQPGRAKILPEVKRLERWLKEPDVGLAFDPEWAVGPGQVPGRVFGHTTGAELDSIASYLSGLVRANNLPEKVFVFHQLSTRIVSNEKALTKHPGVVTIKSVDGIGARADKLETWGKLTATLPPAVHAGFKLFYTEDTRHGPLMTPPQVLALRPRPEFVVYE
ncbi:hypothetical protein E0H75_38060 [Kribbella capetownensis]|uniref:Lipoprotein n=1 Tax=Kribbella capetownensis TaxID=1572659 RepID=A0A4R0J9F6_9ACTN|nr:hypothetical protein [Kribbella capetownensis]TCC42819.1 hypothetical protein E0H75_38060 [Kribbella capetownensis]